MTADHAITLRGSRMRVPRTRGALGGLALLILGAWAAIVPFIGPYFDFGFTPAPDTAWYWTAARGYLEVAPGAAAFVGGLLLLLSTSRVAASFGGWLGMAAGAWLIVGPPLADLIGLDIGGPDPAASTAVQALEQLFYFYAIGAAILLVSAAAVGRLSVHSVRDVRAAERRATAAQELAEQQRLADERRLAEEDRLAREQRVAAEPQRPMDPTRSMDDVGRHDTAAVDYPGTEPAATTTEGVAPEHGARRSIWSRRAPRP